jgi:hypothetical protein
MGRGAGVTPGPFPHAARRTRRACLHATGSPWFLPWAGSRPTVKLGLHLRYPPPRTHASLIGRVGVHAGDVTIRWRIFRYCSLQLSSRFRDSSEPLPPFALWPALPVSRQVVTPATTTAAPPHPWPVGRRCAQPDARRWPRRHRADQRWFPCSLVDRSAEEAPDSAPATSPWLPRSTSPRPPLSPADMSGSSPPP